MKSQADFAIQYQQLPDAQLMLLADEGELVEEAKQALAAEIRARNLRKADLIMHEKKSPHERREEAAQEKTFWSGRSRIGLYFYGKHYLTEADKAEDIQLRTKWFVFASIPLIPLASYRFKCKQKSLWWFSWNTDQRVVDRVPLNWNQICLTWLKSILLAIAFVTIATLYIWLTNRR